MKNEALKKRISQKTRGYAMLAVLFAFAMVLALGTAALAAASSAVNSASHGIRERQAYLTATSVQRVLRAELTTQDSDINKLADDLAEGGDSAVLNVELTAQDMGGAKCTLTRSGERLTVSVAAEYGGTGCTLKQRLKLVSGNWEFEAFIP